MELQQISERIAIIPDEIDQLTDQLGAAVISSDTKTAKGLQGRIADLETELKSLNAAHETKAKQADAEAEAQERLNKMARDEAVTADLAAIQKKTVALDTAFEAMAKATIALDESVTSFHQKWNGQGLDLRAVSPPEWMDRLRERLLQECGEWSAWMRAIPSAGTPSSWAKPVSTWNPTPEEMGISEKQSARAAGGH